MESIVIEMPLHDRMPLSSLSRLAAAAQIATGLLLLFMMVVMTGFFLTPLLFMIGSLIVAGLMSIGWRWTPALGALWSGFLLVFNAQSLQFDLSHPNERLFGFITFFAASLVVGLLTGLGATVQNYRQPISERRIPRWVPYALLALVALCLGTDITAAMPREAEASFNVSPEAVAKLPVLTAGVFKFEQTELHVKAGQPVVLQLQNHDSGAHSFDIDELNIHARMPSGKTSLAVFEASKPGTYTFYCSVPGHREAMHGSLIVEP